MTTPDGTKPDRSLIAVGERGIQLTNFEELLRFSSFVIKAGLAPKGIDTPEKVFLTVQAAMELCIPPMTALQNAAIINNRVSFYGDLALALCQASPHFEDLKIEESGEGELYEVMVTAKRKGRSPTSGRFSVKEAKAAGLLGGSGKSDTWGRYPKRMCFWRACHIALKGSFSDILKGFKGVEEQEGDTFETAKPARAKDVSKPFAASSFSDLPHDDVAQPLVPEPETKETEALFA